ncbi:hypothetical protein L1987_45458 [Smallanthus sonchifolius]|uniref:Uncharacterized protein n=1 Tax=Smallanthus sonchifolius TaxID=185202 RepID=A0ACB9FXN1_9ASTR|nr:hypothetical protein L1987_45458 [Smallanthus sonchifolius]
MNMKRQEKRLFSWRLAGLMVVVVLFISMAELVKSQSSDRNSTLMRYYCSLYYGRSLRYFLSNLKSTLSSFHEQLTNGSRYAVARTLLNGESVWGLASCRAYVSNANCVACYDYAVAQLRVCGTVNGGRDFYDDCDVRYENNNFYVESNIRAGVTTDITPFLGDGKASSIPEMTLSMLYSYKSTGSTDLLQGPAKYSYDDIIIATSSFSDEHKLGGGVFGEVYKVPKDEHGELERLDKLVNKYERYIYDYAHV